MNVMALRERVGGWIAGRAASIAMTPESASNYYGAGLGSNQPGHDALLRENIGVADIATRAIANRLSTLNPQVKVSRRMSDGTLVDEVLDDHILKTLLDKPHEDFTRKQILRLFGQYIVTTGEAYLLKIRNGFSIPAALQPIPPQSIGPVIRGGFITGYVIRDGKGATHRVAKSEVVRPWFPDPEAPYSAEGYLGPNSIVADSLKFASEHLRNHYQHDATPIGMIKATSDATSDPKEFERWQNEYVRKYHRRGGSHRSAPAMLPDGWDWVALAMESGADVTPLLDHWQSNMLMNFGVPPSTLGRVVSGDRSSAETNDWVFDKHAVLPIATMISDALTLQLAPDFDEKIFVEFEPFVAEDKEFNLKREAQDLTLKVRSGQQVIEDRGGDPERAGWAELPVGTLADQPYSGEEFDVGFEGDDPGALFDPEEDAEDEDGRGATSSRAKIAPHRATSKARAKHFSPEAEWARVVARDKKFRPKFERSLRSIFNAQRKEAIRRLEAMNLPDRARADVSVADLFDPTAWDKLFEVRVEPLRRAAYLDSAAEALAGIGLDQTFSFTPTLVKRLDRFGAVMVKQTGATTVRKLQKALAKGAEEGQGIGSIAKGINEAFGVRRRNATTIARTELLRATQDAQIESFDQSGVVERKAWNDNQDNDVRDEHFGGLIATVPIDEVFVLAGGGGTAMYPGDASLDPSQSINCRCFVTPEFSEE